MCVRERVVSFSPTLTWKGPVSMVLGPPQTAASYSAPQDEMLRAAALQARIKLGDL